MNVRGTKISSPALVVFIGVLALALGVSAGSLTPPGTVASTMHSLADIYTSIASSAFDSSSLTANRNGSLIQNLKYIEQNITWASSSGNIWNLNSGNVGIGTTTPITQLHVPIKIPSAATGSVTLSTSQGETGLFVQGRYAYVTNAISNLLYVVDVSSASFPALVSSTITNSAPYGVSVRGQYAYVVNFLGDTLQIFDISNPKSPTSMGTVGITHHSFSIYVQGRYAYIGSQNGLRIVDISNPSAPVSAGVNTGGDLRGISVQGTYAYAVDTTNNLLKVYNVSNPSSPRKVASVSTGNNPSSLAVQGSFAYVRNLADSLEVFNISDPTAPRQVGSVGTAAGANSGVFFFSSFVEGRYVYVTDVNSAYTESKLEVYDVSDPLAPVLAGSVSDTLVGIAFNAVFVSGRYAYVLDYTNRLQVFDMGGSYIQHLEAGAVEGGSLTLRDGLQVNTDADIRGGLVVGQALMVGGPMGITIASLSDTIASVSRSPLFKITQGRGYFASDGLLMNLAANTTQEKFTGNFAKFQLAGSNRIILGSGGEILASGAAQFGSAGAPTSVSYSRFGTSAATATWITTADDLLLSHDLQVLGSGSFTGNVGIGTTTPGLGSYGRALTVATTGSEANAPTVELSGSTSVAGEITGAISYRNSSSAPGYEIAKIVGIRSSAVGASNASGDIGFYTKDLGGVMNSRMTIDAVGNVGIASSSPSALLGLDIASFAGGSTTKTQGELISGNAGGSPGYIGYRINLRNNAENFSGFIRGVRTSVTTFIGLELGAETNHGIRFLTNGTDDTAEKMRITNTGNVGIGTTTPEAKFEVIGIASISVLFASDGTLASPSYSFGTDQNTGIYRSGNGQISISANGTEILRITSDQVQLPNGGSQLLVNSNFKSTGDVFRFYNSSGDNFASFQPDYANLTTAVYPTLNTVGTNRGLAFKSTLDAANANTSFSFFTGTKRTAGNIFSISNFGDGQFQIPGGPGELFSVDYVGNVGIGGIIPQARLDIRGSLSFDLLNIASASGDTVLHITKAGNVGIGTTNVDAKFELRGTASISNGFFVDATGNVGIGTTGPQTRIAIETPAGAGNDEMLRLTKRGGYGETGLYEYYVSPNDYGFRIGRSANSSGFKYFSLNLDSGNVGIGTLTPAATLDVRPTTSYAGPLLIVASGSNERLRVTSAGNLGIGTTNVDAKFEIKGNTLTASSLASLSATSLNGGSVFNITVPASSSSNNPHGLMLVQSDTGTVIASWSMGGKLAIRGPLFSHGGGSSSCTGINAPTSGCVDYAESYFTDDPTLKAGDVVSLDPHHPGSILRATGPSQALGVISTNPAALITGSDLKTGAEALNNPPGTLPVALAGRVPVRITASVSAGDRLSAGPDGSAVRATTAGLTLGIALDNAQSGTVLMFVDNSYWAPDVEAISGEASSSGGSTPTEELSLFARILDYLKNIILTVRELVANTIEVKSGVTTYDEDTGQAYCIKVKGGQLVSVSGACGMQASPVPSPSSTSTPPDTPAPIPTESVPTTTETPTLTDGPPPTDTPAVTEEPAL